MITRKVTPDRNRVEMGDPSEARRWRKALDASVKDIARAVAKVGNSAAAVRKELRNGCTAKPGFGSHGEKRVDQSS
jgi:hypothetical protein